MPRLILNADDFGLTPGVNRAIRELSQQHALTSATLMAEGAAFEDALRVAQEQPQLGVGCHIVLVDGAPTAPAKDVFSLIDPKTGQFRPSLVKFLLDLHTDQISEEHIAHEAYAQIRRLQDAGIHVTHVDTHKHTHIFPRVARPVLRAAMECGVRAIRNPFEHAWSSKLAKRAIKRRAEVAALRLFERSFLALGPIATGQVKTSDGCLGVSATGSLDTETLRLLLQHMPEGTWEMVTHPGYNDQDLSRIQTRLRETRETELSSLLELIPSSGVERIHFGNL